MIGSAVQCEPRALCKGHPVEHLLQVGAALQHAAAQRCVEGGSQCSRAVARRLRSLPIWGAWALGPGRPWLARGAWALREEERSARASCGRGGRGGQCMGPLAKALEFAHKDFAPTERYFFSILQTVCPLAGKKIFAHHIALLMENHSTSKKQHRQVHNCHSAISQIL